MTGFDEEAKSALLAAMTEDGVKTDARLMSRIITLAFAAELEYMKKAGILDENDEFRDGTYDDDDAFDYMTEALSKQLPSVDPYKLTDYLEYYCEYHDRYLQDNGLLAWL